MLRAIHVLAEFREGSSPRVGRRSRAAAAANPWAPRPVLTVEEVLLVADDADEADELGYPVPELHE